MASYPLLIAAAFLVTLQLTQAVWDPAFPACTLIRRDGTGFKKAFNVAVAIPEARNQQEIDQNPQNFCDELLINGEWESTTDNMYMKIDYPNGFDPNNKQFFETQFRKDTNIDPRTALTIGRDPNDASKVLVCVKQLIDRDGATSNFVDDIDILQIKDLLCETKGSAQLTLRFSLTIVINDINDNPPVFTFLPGTTSYEVSINEGTTLGMIYNDIRSNDLDMNQNKMPHYDIVDVTNPHVNTAHLFRIRRPNVGEVSLLRTVDFEQVRQQPYFLVKISATDNYDDSSPTAVKQTSYTILKVNIIDIDDQHPAFVIPGCTPAPNLSCLKLDPIYNTVTDGLVGSSLNIMPVAIKAKDQDALNYPIQYGIRTVYPSSFAGYFAIDQTTGAMSVARQIDQSRAMEDITVLVSAHEVPPTVQTPPYKTILATLVIKVRSGNTSPQATSPTSSAELNTQTDISTSPCSPTIECIPTSPCSPTIEIPLWVIVLLAVLGGLVVCLIIVIIVLKCCAAVTTKEEKDRCCQDKPECVNNGFTCDSGDRVHMYSIPKNCQRPAVGPNDVYVDLQEKEQQKQPAPTYEELEIQTPASREAPGSPEPIYIEPISEPEQPEYEDAL